MLEIYLSHVQALLHQRHDLLVWVREGVVDVHTYCVEISMFLEV